jgi:predicted nucleotide-binding protein
MPVDSPQDQQAIQAYFSHSYRAEDREVNLFFWRLFSENGFFFTVDPQSDRLFVPHLVERLIRLSDCFIAVVTRRLEYKKKVGDIVLAVKQPVWTHSPYVEFESRLSIRSDKPRLVFVENGLAASLFGEPEEVLVFDRDTLSKWEKRYSRRVQEFADAARDYKRYSDRHIFSTRKAGIMLKQDNDFYSKEILDVIAETLEIGGFTSKQIPSFITDDQEMVRQLSDLELVVTETREPFVSATARSFVHAKFIPTIHLHALRPGEDKNSVVLPETLATGYAIGDIEPVITWKTKDDLALELIRYMPKFQQARTTLGDFEAGKRYFMRAGRRDARVFISNSHDLNAAALELVKGLRSVSIECFHYMNSMRIGETWKEELDRELEKFDFFVALIDDDYHTSRWCQYELDHAFKRWQNKEVAMLPYVLPRTPFPDLIKDYIQCASLSDTSPNELAKIVETIDALLIEMEQSPSVASQLTDKDSRQQNDFRYDIFISYSHKDKSWVNGVLLPRLEREGLRVCIDDRDFEIGVPSLFNIENAVEHSRKTLLVLTPNWIESNWTEFEALLLQTNDPAGRRRRILPLMVQHCTPPSHLQVFTYLDLTDPTEIDSQMRRLVTAVRTTP